MEIAVIGMNQETAPIQIRNKVAYLESDKIEFITELLDFGISEIVVLATCGRNEIYLCDYKKEIDKTIEVVIDKYSNFFSFPDVKNYLYIKKGNEAIEHLYSVTSGLDSIVLGEDQILGQVKEAHNLAMELGASKKILNRLFRDAITTSKKIKTELKISEHPMSISYIGIKFLLERTNGFDNKKILILGTGKMGKLALEYVMENNPGEVYITNRNFEKVIELKNKYPSIIEVEYANRNSILQDVDVVVSATSSPHHVITKDNLIRRELPLYLLDLAMPQDIDESVTEIDNVCLYNVDSLNKISSENEQKRKELSIKAIEMIEVNVKSFNSWMLSTKVDPMIKSLNMLRVLVEADTLEYLHRKLDLKAKEKRIIDKMISSSLKRMIRNPIIKLKEMDDEVKMLHYLEVLKDLFGLDGE